MVKIRLHGTKEDIEKSREVLKNNFDILSESGLYKDRNSLYYRMYLDCEIKKTK